MSFMSEETSKDGSIPIEVYRFKSHETFWRYNSSSEIVSIDEGGENGVQDYIPTLIKRSNIVYTEEIDRIPGITIEMNFDNELVQSLIQAVHESPITLIVGRRHLDSSSYIIFWQGRIVNTLIEDNFNAKLIGESMLSALQRSVINEYYQIRCRHTLFDEKCTIDKTTYSRTGTVSEILSNTEIKIGGTALVPGYAENGFAVCNGYQYRNVITNTVNKVYLSKSIPGLEVGDTITVYAGCNRTREVCDERFNNLLNYGGFAFIPEESPFINIK